MTRTPTHEDIVRLLGPMSDQVVADIMKVDASEADLEAVAMWLAQEDEVLGEARRPLSGPSAVVYDIAKGVEDDADWRCG
jgi:dsDNA-binding SOS-regulon protein